MFLRSLASLSLALGTIAAVLLLAGLAVVVGLIAWGWVRIVTRIARLQPAIRGRQAIRSRPPRRDDGELATARGFGWFVIDEQAGFWPRQWPIPGLTVWHPDDWSFGYDSDGRRGLAVAKEVMAKGRVEAVGKS